MTATLNKTLKNKEIVCHETQHRVQCTGTKICALLGCYIALPHTFRDDVLQKFLYWPIKCKFNSKKNFIKVYGTLDHAASVKAHRNIQEFQCDLILQHTRI
jgi:hypothetical protein